MSETYPSSPGDQSPQPKPGERSQPYDPKELLFGILRGEVSQAEARQVMEREAIDHVSGGLVTVREAMEHTDGIAPDLTDQAPRRLDVAEHDDAGQAVERRYRAEDMISESDIYLRAVELDRESLQDMIQGALDSLTDGDTELRGLVEGSSRYLASKQAAEAGELIYPEHFKSQIESLIASEWSSKDYSEQKQKLLTDVSVIMHVRTLMDTMQ